MIMKAKKASEIGKAKQLYDEGKVLEAANLGYSEAMAEMDYNHSQGVNGFELDYAKGFEFATKAANEDDENGMIYLAYYYDVGHCIEKNRALALSLV